MKSKLRGLLILSFTLCAIAYSQGPRTLKIEADDAKLDIVEKAAKIVPTSNQYNYKKLEFTCFIHFGPNTFSGKEWGNGFEDPAIFNPTGLDTDQWCRLAKEAGMKLIMLTVKHHDGFVLWQSRYTKHGIMSSPFQNGKGDILRELSKSCEKYGLKLGVYLSPADLYQIENKNGLYGNLSEYAERIIPRPVEGRAFKDKRTFKFVVDDYNEYFLNQLFELLTEYGPVHEVWFDGAHPKHKGGQKYNYLAWKELIKTLAPEAVIFGKEDVRWIGNESGTNRETEWDVVTFEKDPAKMAMFPDMHGDLGSREKLYKGKYLHFLPGEADTSIREGWFYRNEDEQGVRSADDVFDIYERCVGSNSVLLLNIPPNKDGRFSDREVKVLKEVGKRIRKTYATNLLDKAIGENALLDESKDTYVSAIGGKGSYEITLPKAITLNRFVLQEAIHLQGQRIEKHALDVWVNGQWEQIAEGTTVGYKKILRFADITTNKLRLRITEGRSNPSVSSVSAHYYVPRPPQLSIDRDLDGKVTVSVKKHDFGWKHGGHDPGENLSGTSVIRYTTDGSEPTADAQVYSSPFFLESGMIKARSFNNGVEGAVSKMHFGLVKKEWVIMGDKSGIKRKAIDADPATFWSSGNGEPNLTIDLGSVNNITGFIYTPPIDFKEGLIEKGIFKVSKDGKTWKEVTVFDFGNLINDPTPRTARFNKVVKARYVKIELLAGAGGSTSATIAEIDILKE